MRGLTYVVLFLASVSCSGEEFDKLIGDAGQTAQPRVFGEAESRNLDQILKVVNAKRSPLIWVLQQQTLSNELNLTEEQTELLSSIKSRTAGEIQMGDLAGSGDPYRLSKAGLRTYLANLSRLVDIEAEKSDEMVLAVLNKEQQTRLIQIAFQEQLLSYRDARRALLYHNITISDKEHHHLREKLYRVDNQLKVFEAKLRHQLRLDAIDGTLAPFGGSRFYFEADMINTDACAEQYRLLNSESSEKPTKSNVRRNSSM